MSSNNVKQENAVSSVEGVIEFLTGNGLPIKSLTMIHDVIAGVILGEVDEVDHEMELAAGVTYLVVGLGKLPNEYKRGIDLVNIKGQ